MSKFVRYDSEFIQLQRPNKNTIISEKLSKHFDWINELFLQSTQYQDNRKKINYNQINSQKWRNNNINIVNSILLMLNGIDTSLYNEIEHKIISIEIKDINNMRKIIDILHEKSCESFNSNTVLDLYINILHKIIVNGIWYYKIGDRITDYICPRIVAVSIAQKNYLEMLDTFLSIIDNFNKTNDEVSYFKVKNQKFIGNMLFIAKLYNKQIISIEIINTICNDILTKVNTDLVNIDLLEFLLHLLSNIRNYPNIDKIVDELTNISTKISSRIKYLIINFIDSHSKKKVSKIENVKIETKQVIDDSNESYNNLIMEYLINFNENNVNSLAQDFVNSLKKKVDGELVLTILRKYNPRCEEKLTILLSKLLEKKVITQQEINNKLELYDNNGELEDIAEECPIVRKFVDKIKK
jgi:uncharacterized protein (UPF0335 family)